MIKVAIASDHAGIGLKATLIQELEKLGTQAIDLGTDSESSVDYPDFADTLAAEILAKRADLAVAICGSGIGMSIAANRHKGVRAALCRSGLEAKLARQHNDANILCLGARITGVESAIDCLKAFLTTSFEGGRHSRRVGKLG